MDQVLPKNWIALGMGLILIAGLRWMNHHWFIAAPTVQVSSESYEMLRPKSAAGSFDLSGREIDREYLADEEVVAAKNKDTSTLAKALADHKKDAKKTAANKPSSLDKAKFSSQVVDTTKRLGLSSTANESSVVQNQVGGFVNMATANSETNPSNNSNNQQQKISAAEWMSLLSTHATAQLIAEFNSAHEQNDISDADFYNIAFTLFTASSAQNQQTGTEILTDDSSPGAFSNIALEISKVTTTQQASLNTIINTFAQPTKFVSLNFALNSSNVSVTTLALKTVALAVQNVQQQLSVQNQNGNRGVAGSVQPQSLKLFDNNLSHIATAGSSSNAQSATTLLAEIQTLNQ